jgi:hypothetical protein
MNDISPLDAFNRLLHYWWVVALAMMLGGMLGWVFSIFLQPIYEATALYNVHLDEETILKFAREENPDATLDYVTINKYLGPVELIFYEPETRADLEKLAKAQGLNYVASDFNVNDFIVDRRGWDWTIIVRNHDAQTAARLGNLWMQVTNARLQKLRQKSIDALGLEIQAKALSACFDGRSLAQANQCAGKSFTSVEEAAKQLEALDKQAQSLRGESKGISELVTLFPVSDANTPLRAVMYRTSMLALMGSFIGLIVGAILIQRLPVKAGD